MYLLIIFLPLISFFFSSLFTNFISKKGSLFITVSCMFFCMIISFFIFYEIVLSKSICTLKLFPWIISNTLIISWGFFFDNLTATMLIVVTSISFLVHIYSLDYMGSDPHLPRFMSYLSLFTFFMLILISADNFVQMFVGWEGVGLASYLLINFWHMRIAANKSAMKAIIINRIGDFGISLGIAAIIITVFSVDFPVLFTILPFQTTETFEILNFNVSKITCISLFLFIGAIGKSAQIGLHTWLPDAMEGPTPVSALIHAATMVTAGVFILLRCSFLLEYSETILTIITIFGALTAFMAATIGVVQNDLKRVIAYSTCSQLGYMVFSIGLSNYSISLFHLMNHAFFKALLFLSAGSVIHAMSDEQDMRKMGGLFKLIPISYIMIFIGSLSLMGFPFLTGFYSKDMLLELTYGVYTSTAFFAYWLGVLSAFFTSFYSIRLLVLTFLGNYNGPKSYLNKIHESSWILLIPLMILALCSIFWGFIFKELFMGLNVETWNNVFFVLPWHFSNFKAEFLPVSIKLIPVFFSLIGGVSSYFFYLLYQFNIENLLTYKLFYPIYHFLNKKWYFDDVYNKIIALFFLNIGYRITFKALDRGLFEFIGPFGLVWLLKTCSKWISLLQTGLVYNYILIMIIGIISFISLLIIPMFWTVSLLFIYFYLFIFIFSIKL